MCRPQGGLNDMLTQIENCCRYACKTGRKVVVDTNYQYASHWRDSFERYFVSQELDLLLDVDEVKERLSTMSVFPHQLQGRLDLYKPSSSPATGLIDSESGVPLTFDFSKSYKQQLLLHHRYGGGGSCLVLFEN